MNSCSAPFNIIVKPIGSVCNLDCEYCYYLEKYKVVTGSHETSQVMDDHLLEVFTRDYIQSQPEHTEEVVFSWQGGEPTLLGIEFFEKALSFQRTYARPGMRILNALQTNGTLVSGDFARFFKDNGFLIGVSIDGPEELHNRYRKDKAGKGSFPAVMRGLEQLQRYDVDYNTLTVVQNDNGSRPQEVYAFLREIGSRHLQFIPIVEESSGRTGARSVGPQQWGSFLNGVFDSWLSGDVGRVFVQHFDLLLGRYLGYPPSLCVHAQTCGRALALEHNGNLYSCDHFVDPEHLLGNIREAELADLVDSERQLLFGKHKFLNLSDTCRSCTYLGLCYGGCPRNRIPGRENGKDLNYLCEGYKLFYEHTRPYITAMAQAVRNKRTAADYIPYLDPSIFMHADRNGRCPCGSGRKFKHCHGRS